MTTQRHLLSGVPPSSCPPMHRPTHDCPSRHRFPTSPSIVSAVGTGAGTEPSLTSTPRPRSSPGPCGGGCSNAHRAAPRLPRAAAELGLVDPGFVELQAVAVHADAPEVLVLHAEDRPPLEVVQLLAREIGGPVALQRPGVHHLELQNEELLVHIYERARRAREQKFDADLAKVPEGSRP